MHLHGSTPQRHSGGFTLLEVLVVLAIIGGLMSMATLTSRSNPALDETRQFSRKLTALLDAYREDAVFQNVDFGLAMNEQQLTLLSYLDPNSLQAKALDGKQQALLEKNPWQPHSEGPLKKSLELPQSVYIRLLIEDTEVDLDELKDEDEGDKPALLFLSSDEYTPFKLELAHQADNRFVVRISGDGFSPLVTEVEQYED